jgi:hypothetical protein
MQSDHVTPDNARPADAARCRATVTSPATSPADRRQVRQLAEDRRLDAQRAAAAFLVSPAPDRPGDELRGPPHCRAEISLARATTARRELCTRKAGNW